MRSSKENFENKIEPAEEQPPEFFENPEAEKRARENLYSEKMPYHNFDGHILDSIAEGRKIVQGCRKEGIPINEEVVYYGDLYHDAGWHEDYKEKGFSSREEYSLYLAGEEMRKLGIPEKTISKTQSAIWATHRAKKFVTNEEKAVRASDLAAMAKDYETFFQNAAKLKMETEMMSGQGISWPEWKNRVKKLVEFYLSQDIHLTGAHDDENGESVWHKKVKENLEKFLKEDEKVTKKQAA